MMPDRDVCSGQGVPVETQSKNAFPKLWTLSSTTAQCQSGWLSYQAQGRARKAPQSNARCRARYALQRTMSAALKTEGQILRHRSWATAASKLSIGVSTCPWQPTTSFSYPFREGSQPESLLSLALSRCDAKLSLLNFLRFYHWVRSQESHIFLQIPTW